LTDLNMIQVMLICILTAFCGMTAVVLHPAWFG
jgi:hypothetical protein